MYSKIINNYQNKLEKCERELFWCENEIKNYLNLDWIASEQEYILRTQKIIWDGNVEKDIKSEKEKILKIKKEIIYYKKQLEIFKKKQTEWINYILNNI